LAESASASSNRRVTAIDEVRTGIDGKFCKQLVTASIVLLSMQREFRTARMNRRLLCSGRSDGSDPVPRKMSFVSAMN